MKNNKWFYIALINLFLIYMIGIWGITSSSMIHQQLFLKLSPVNLILTTFCLLLFHEKWNLKFIAYSFLIFLLGFTLEVIGANTGFIFGHYYYGKTLGFSIFHVPLIIGLNWFLLIYCIGTVFYEVKNNLMFCLVCAGIMTLLDVFIEPVAIKLDFWHWQNDNIPLQNYLAWFILSFSLFFIFRKANGKISNRFSTFVLSLQFCFFGILNILLI